MHVAWALTSRAGGSKLPEQLCPALGIQPLESAAVECQVPARVHEAAMYAEGNLDRRSVRDQTRAAGTASPILVKPNL